MNDFDDFDIEAARRTAQARLQQKRDRREAERIQLLRAEIRDSLAAIEETYQRIEEAGGQAAGSERDIVLAYYLQVLYSLFESFFTQIAVTFGNEIDNQAHWQAHLLKRMSLDIPSVRPPVISRESYIALNELRGFRHLFRNAYLLQFDPDRLNLVLRAAFELKVTYPADIDRFLDFLERLTQSET